jgi:hypothetical protein
VAKDQTLFDRIRLKSSSVEFGRVPATEIEKSEGQSPTARGILFFPPAGFSAVFAFPKK